MQLVETSSGGAWDAGRALGIVTEHAAVPGGALPMLHALQAAFGYIPKQVEAMMAEALNLSKAEVHGIVSFYHDFRHAPAGRHVLKLCRAEACQSVGAVNLAARVLERLGIGWGETTRDGGLTVEPVYCLGLCACGPAALLDGEPLARLEENSLCATLDAARAA